MLKAKTPLLVGLLVIIGAVAFVFSFGSLSSGVDTDDAYPLYALFDDATGLVPNSRVMMSGIEVGRLGEIALDADNPALARVELFLQKKIHLKKGTFKPERKVWMNGATAVRKQASLIGDYYVALTAGIDGPALKAGETIPTVVSEAGLSAVIRQLESASSAIFPKVESIMDDIKSITAGLKQTVGEAGAVEDLQGIRNDIRQTTQNVAALTGELRTFLREDIYPRGDNIQGIMANVERTTATVRDSSVRTTAILERLLTRLDEAAADVGQFVAAQTASPEDAASGTVAKTIATLDKNMAILEGSLENVRAITARVEQGKGTVGRLLNDDKLIDDVEQVVSDLRSITGSFGQTEVKLAFRSDYFVERSAFKQTIGVSLHPSPDKYYLIQLVDDPAGSTRVTRRVTTTNDPRLTPVLVEDIVETSDALKFTVQMAKRWRFLTFRYGIMENTGGLGLDADLLDDTLNFKMDVFDFGRDEFPRVRLLAQWEFMNHFMVSAGVDEMLNAHRRDYFFGLGVQFTDDDLKAILPLAPSP